MKGRLARASRAGSVGGDGGSGRPAAAADAVYHTEQLVLTPVVGAPLRSGFVKNIKAEGPQDYARELFALN